MKTATLVLVTALLSLPIPVAAQSTEDERRMDEAFRLVMAGDLDRAEALLHAVSEEDRNGWMVLHGLPERHWLASDYLDLIERRRAGDDSDQLFSSERFRFHVRGAPLGVQEQARLVETFEHVLDRVVAWSGEEGSWTGEDSRLVFVEIAESFPTPSPARTLIFFWDRQDRAIRTEFTQRALDPRFLTPIAAHELTHAVMPHTCRPFAEGLANLVARETFPEQPSPLRRRSPPPPEPWSLEEVLLFDVRAQGVRARRQIELLKQGGFSSETVELTAMMYEHGDDLVEMLLDGWGRDTLIEIYRATNRDPADFDLVEHFTRELAPLEELQRMWRERVGG